MRLDVVAVQICNPITNQSTNVYVFQDSGSQLTLLRKSAAEETGLHGIPHIQSSRGMHAMANILLKSADIQIHGIHVTEAFDITDVKIADTVPELQHSLPGTLGLEEHENFCDLTYPTINRDRCDMLIGSDNVNLLEVMDEPSSHRVSGSLYARHSPFCWIIYGSVPKIKENYQLTEYDFITEELSEHEFDE